MSSYEALVFEQVEDKIFRVTLNRPEKRNALSAQLLTELDRVMDECEGNLDASVLIIRGAGRTFCAGYDLQFTSSSGGGFTVTRDRLSLHQLVRRWQRLWALRLVTIAQVQGHAIGGGNELVGHCDIVFASEDASFGHPASRSLGTSPTLGLWTYLMGPRRAKQFTFTGDMISARQALALNLVNEVVPKDELEEAVLGYARRVAMVPTDLLMLHKYSINRITELMGMRTAEQASADLDALAHQTAPVKNFLKTSREKGLKSAFSERDKPFSGGDKPG